MNGASKILTVSYGTFSCTLEGFDDPFNTMRAIAEYFRDLAADDRYFGAEPPTPDAAMLSRIAEREIQRRVETKVGDNGVTLRAEEAPRVTMPAVQPAPVPVPAPVLASVAEAAPAVESAAARLSRLRATQSQIMAPAAASVMDNISSRFADVEAYAEDQDDAVAFAPAPILAPVITAQPEPVVVTEPEPEPVAEPVIAAPEVIAEAVAEPVLDALRETLAGLIGQDDQLAVDMAAEDDQAVVIIADDDPLPEDAADLSNFDAPVEDFDQSDLDDLPALDGVPAADPVDPIISPIIDDAAYLEAEVETDIVEQEWEDVPPKAAKVPEIDLSPEAPIFAEKIQRARARVIKIRRLDKKPEAARLSPEAEADLQSTLAALEAELAPLPDTADLAPAQPEKAAEIKLASADDAVDRLLAQTNSQLEVPETKRRRSAIAHLKAAVLATVADRKNNPAATAAVAEVKMNPYRKDLDQAVRPTGPALQGDRPAPLVLVSAQRIDRKRDAVADANRPVPQIVPSVAPKVATVMPVRPRRVSSGGLAQAVSAQPLDDEDSDLAPETHGNIFAAGTKQSFAEFAESLGAQSLADLIEAAGAYCTLVLDRPSFTRPQLFQQISTMADVAEVNREDSLRGFGKLLRDGRIQKTVRGQFALSDTSPILTEAKRIAG